MTKPAVVQSAAAAVSALIVLLACQALAPIAVLLFTVSLLPSHSLILGALTVLIGTAAGVLCGRWAITRRALPFNGGVVCAVLTVYAGLDALYRLHAPARTSLTSTMAVTEFLSVAVLSLLVFGIAGRQPPSQPS